MGVRGLCAPFSLSLSLSLCWDWDEDGDGVPGSERGDGGAGECAYAYGGESGREGAVRGEVGCEEAGDWPVDVGVDVEADAGTDVEWLEDGGVWARCRAGLAVIDLG